MRDGRPFSGEGGGESPKEHRFLPEVTVETAKALQAEVSQKGESKYSRDVLRRMAKDNEHVAQFIALLMESSSDKEKVMQCGVIVYRLLESQAEADKMRKEFDVK